MHLRHYLARVQINQTNSAGARRDLCTNRPVSLVHGVDAMIRRTGRDERLRGLVEREAVGACVEINQ